MKIYISFKNVEQRLSNWFKPIAAGPIKIYWIPDFGGFFNVDSYGNHLLFEIGFSMVYLMWIPLRSLKENWNIHRSYYLSFGQLLTKFITADDIICGVTSSSNWDPSTGPSFTGESKASRAISKNREYHFFHVMFDISFSYSCAYDFKSFLK